MKYFKFIFYLLLSIIFVGCKNIQTKNNDIESKNAILELENDKLKEENKKLLELDSTKKTISYNAESNENIIQGKINSLAYIKDFGDKYPFEVMLFEQGILKDRLLNLLGNQNYELFLSYSDVQSPIQIVNNSWTLITSCEEHAARTYSIAVFIDFDTDKITVGILNNTKIEIFSEISTNPNKFSSAFFTWYYKAKENSEENKKFN